ncbi:MAG: hypothetical protein NVS4B12_03360 [Ktedonobacteraceae bacterium]
MYTADRQRALPYLTQVPGPLYEQWYLLHHRMLRIVTNHAALAEQVRTYFYYAELLAEATYTHHSEIPIAIPIDLLWKAGERLYKPIALTCYLFETQPNEAFPPPPAQAKPDEVEWEAISGVEGPLRSRWKKGAERFREYHAYPDVTSRVCSVLNKDDLYAMIYIKDVQQCASWFTMRFIVYMVIGAMFNRDGYEVVHAGAIALHGNGALLVGSPGSGKSTLVLSCLLAGMQHLGDDVLFLARDEGVVHIYGFPEDIGVRKGTAELLGQHEFMRILSEDEREKRYIATQHYFREQVITSCPIRVLLFIAAKQRAETFRAEQIPSVQAVSLLMKEYISRQQAIEYDVEDTFQLFSDMAEQSVSYRLWLSPNAQENAEQVRLLLALNTNE